MTRADLGVVDSAVPWKRRHLPLEGLLLPSIADVSVLSLEVSREGAARGARSPRRNAIERTLVGNSAATAAINDLPVTLISETPTTRATTSAPSTRPWSRSAKPESSRPSSSTPPTT
jgi:hypothetical protein